MTIAQTAAIVVDAVNDYGSALRVHIEKEISLSMPIGEKGSTVFNKQNGTRKNAAGMVVQFGEFVETDAELNDSKGRIVTMQSVFNEWYRFSHNGTDLQPAVPAETTAWAYDAVNDKITCTMNSASYIGFISKRAFDSYVNEVRVSSSNGDDDGIGLVIAFAVDDAGKEHTLSVVRSTGGVGFTWSMYYNFGRTGYKIIDNNSSAIAWGNGGYGNNGTEAGYTSNAGGGWAANPTGTLIKVTRDADVIKAITTEMGSDVYVPASEFNINLTSDPLLAIFRGPQRYGFSALSQPSASWKTLNFSETDNIIYDVRTDQVLTHNGVDWVINPEKSIYKNIGAGRLAFNEISGKLYFVETDSVKKLAG